MADAPALKLWNNKKEQEKYENLAGGRFQQAAL